MSEKVIRGQDAIQLLTGLKVVNEENKLGIDWNNPEQVKKWYREYHQKNKEKINKQQREYYQKRRHKAIDKLGGKCVICGWSDKRALCFDHINSDGRGERKRGMKGSYLYNWILETPLKEVKKKMQILCENHNRIKQRENKEYPNIEH